MDRHLGARGPVLLSLTIAVGMAASAEARQVAGDRPAFEAGVRMAAQVNEEFPAMGGGVHVSWNLDPRTAIEGSVDFMPHTNRPYSSWNRMGYVQLKRALHVSGPNRFFGTMGGGGGFEHTTYPRFSNQPPFVILGTSTFRRGVGAFTIGTGYDRALGRHLALDVQAQFVIANSYAGLRTTFGLSVPVGRFAGSTDTGEPRLAAFSNVDVGGTAWVAMADGRLWKGRVASITATTLALAHANGTTLLPVADVRKVEAPDRIMDGTLRGTAIGMTAGIPGFIAGWTWDGDASFAMIVGLAWTGLGAGLGAVVGAIADSFHEGRRVVYESGAAPRISVSPIVSKKGAGLGAVIRW